MDLEFEDNRVQITVDMLLSMGFQRYRMQTQTYTHTLFKWEISCI
jgi:hypothetical protein